MLTVACGGSAGPAAPPVGGADIACSTEWCVEYPLGWEVEEGGTFLSFGHPDAPESAFASVGIVDMRAMVESTGGRWPTAPENAARAFWDLIGGGDASLSRIMTVEAGVRSEGELDGLRLWHLLIPTSGGDAVGIEVRGPNTTWEAHAEVFLRGLIGPAG